MKTWQGEQRSEEWYEWRTKGVGASESAAVFWTSMWKTKVGAWEVKSGRAFPQQTNEHIQRGINLEPEALEEFRRQIADDTFKPMCAEHDDYGCIRTSFDGVNKDATKLVEIKCSNSKKLLSIVEKRDLKALKKEYPDYFVQIQHQLCVCETAKVAYLAIYQDNDLSFMEVDRCDDFIQNKLIPGIIDFWNNHVLTDIAPEPPEPEHIVIDDPEAVSIAKELHNVMKAKKGFDKKEKELRDVLFGFTDDGNCIVGDLKLTRYCREKVDYKKATLDAGIDLEPYTTENIGYWRVTENDYTP